MCTKDGEKEKREEKKRDTVTRDTLHVLEYSAEISRRKDRQSGYLHMRSHGHPVSRVSRVHKATCQWEVRYQSERASGASHPPFSSSQLPAFVPLDLRQFRRGDLIF